MHTASGSALQTWVLCLECLSFGYMDNVEVAYEKRSTQWFTDICIFMNAFVNGMFCSEQSNLEAI